MLTSNVCDWVVVKFNEIPKASFAIFHKEVETNFSTYKNYACKISIAIMNGSRKNDLRLLEVFPILHLRWLTLVWRIARFQKNFILSQKN